MVDLLAHTFQELEHTSTVHAHKGEQHLHLEMQSLMTEQDEDSPAPKIEFSVTPHLVSKLEWNLLASPSEPLAWGRVIPKLPVTFLSLPYPPPKS